MQDDTARRDAERAVISVARKIADEDNRTDVVLATLRTEKRVPVKCSLLRVLGGIANSKALDTLATASRQTDPAVRDRAVRTLVRWPNASAAKILLAIYSDNQNQTHRLLALRGFVRLLAMPATDRLEVESLELCRRAMNQTRTTDEKKLVLSGLSTVAHPDALATSVPFLEIEAVRPEAAMTVMKIANAIGRTHPSKARAAIDKRLAVVQTPHFREQAQETIRRIEDAQEQPASDR